MRKSLAAFFALLVFAGIVTLSAQNGRTAEASGRPEGPCDIYAAAGDPCVAAHSTTRALYRAYRGPLYQVLRQRDGKTLDIGVVRGSGAEPGGYADAAAQDAFCAQTYCWISKVYDQSPKHNDLTQAPRGGFSGPAMGGMNNLPLADMAPATVMGHKVYGVFIEPGMGLRIDDPKGTAVDDQAEGQYWVVNGHHFNDGCCYDYGNAEIDSRDDDNGTMETAYFGDSTGWIHGNPPGPWIMTDQENNLVGCVEAAGVQLCPHLPDIKWRFVTAIAKGEPHHWTSMGGDAQRGELQEMFSGRRVNSSYDPMRKQGAILLGNGGDNSNGSQGTFYEGAVTAAGTFPSNDTDQKVQANVVAAGYAVQHVGLLMAGEPQPRSVETFAPGAPRETTVSFTNVGGTPVSSLVLSLGLPERQWTATVQGGSGDTKTFAEPVAPGATVNATFTVTPGPKAAQGDLVAHARWSGATGTLTETTVQKVRSALPVKLNEFRIGSGAAGNMTDSFIELYNASTSPVDMSGWTLINRPAQQVIASEIHVPAGTTIAAKGFYLLGLSNSGLVAPARAGEAMLSVRSVTGISVGDTIEIGSGSEAESRTVRAIGGAATDPTTLWQPLPDGPIALPVGSTNVPVQSVDGFKVGDRIALGYGGGTPYVGSGMEKYEVATVTAVGKPGLQAYLAADAAAGATTLQVTSIEDISVGDKIRLDIDSLHHGIETVTVTRVGTKAYQTNLTEDVAAGATEIRVRRTEGYKAGDKITVGTPTSMEVVTVQSVAEGGRGGAALMVSALARAHGRDEWVVDPGTGLEVAAPLKFAHAANLPFSDRGTGVTFEPATRFVHVSDEPVQALGGGLTLDKPLGKAHAVHAVVQDGKVTNAGYQGTPKPNQWFGGPELVTRSPLFGRVITVKEGSMVLRDASGVVVDSLNYGGLTDPWAAEGYQAVSGQHEGGCFVPSPDPALGYGAAAAEGVNRSAGRYPDGADTDSNCKDFQVPAATVMPFGVEAGGKTLHVASVADFHAGETVLVGSGDLLERAVIANVGDAGATTTERASEVGATTLSVASPFGFERDEMVTVGTGADRETVKVTATHRFNGFSLALGSPLTKAHAAGEQVAGSGLTLEQGVTRSYAAGAQVGTTLPTPGGPNRMQTAEGAQATR